MEISSAARGPRELATDDPEPAVNRHKGEARPPVRAGRGEPKRYSSWTSDIAADFLQGLRGTARLEVEVVLVDVDDLDARLDDLERERVVGLERLGVVDCRLVMAVVQPSP